MAPKVMQRGKGAAKAKAVAGAKTKAKAAATTKAAAKAKAKAARQAAVAAARRQLLLQKQSEVAEEVGTEEEEEMEEEESEVYDEEVDAVGVIVKQEQNVGPAASQAPTPASQAFFIPAAQGTPASQSSTAQPTPQTPPVHRRKIASPLAAAGHASEGPLAGEQFGALQHVAEAPVAAVVAASEQPAPLQSSAAVPVATAAPVAAVVATSQQPAPLQSSAAVPLATEAPVAAVVAANVQPAPVQSSAEPVAAVETAVETESQEGLATVHPFPESQAVLAAVETAPAAEMSPASVKAAAMQLLAQLESLARAAGVPQEVLYIEAIVAQETSAATTAAPKTAAAKAAAAKAAALTTVAAASDIEVIADDADAMSAADTETPMCAICQCELAGDEGKEALSCSHVFHTVCLQRQAAAIGVQLQDLRCAICRRSATDMERLQQLQQLLPPSAPRLRRGVTFRNVSAPKVAAAPATKAGQALPKHNIMRPPLPPPEPPLSTILQQIADASDGEDFGQDRGSSSGTYAKFSVV